MLLNMQDINSRIPMVFYHGTNKFTFSLSREKRLELSKTYQILAEYYYSVFCENEIDKKLSVLEDAIANLALGANHVLGNYCRKNDSYNYDFFDITSDIYRALRYAENSQPYGELSHYVNNAKKVIDELQPDLGNMNKTQKKALQYVNECEKNYKFQPIVIVYSDLGYEDILRMEDGRKINWERILRNYEECNDLQESFQCKLEFDLHQYSKLYDVVNNGDEIIRKESCRNITSI